MRDLTISQMQQMQTQLQQRYLEKWGGLSPEKSIEKMLWLHGELGEASDILKKAGIHAVMSDPETRRRFVEEMCDAMMYLNDVFLCCDITPEEISEVYTQKFETNMRRW